MEVLGSLMDSRVIQHGSVTKSQQLATSKSNHRDLRISEASATLFPMPFFPNRLDDGQPAEALAKQPMFSTATAPPASQICPRLRLANGIPWPSLCIDAWRPWGRLMCQWYKYEAARLHLWVN